jgi:hypothetical protein
MKLSDYRKVYYEFSGKLSDIVRQLAFAGIAVIWVFKQEAKPVAKIPDAMLVPLVLLVLSLTGDLLHYVASTFIWGTFSRYHERKLKRPLEDPDLTAPRYFNWPALFFLCAKSILLVGAYVFLSRYLFGIWLASI